MNNVAEYIRTFAKIESDFISSLYQENNARNDVQPQIVPELGRLLQMLILLKKPSKILELGTSNGISSLWMADVAKNMNCTITTVDSKERLHYEALKNIEKAGYSSFIKLIYGDAGEIINSLDEKYDIIFQDCGKYLYTELHNKLVNKLNSGGIIIADDTLFKPIGTFRETLSTYMDNYNSMVFADKRLYSLILPVGCGVTLSFKLED